VPSILARALRERTRALHTQAERSGLMQSLLRGEVDRAGYCALLRNLYEIYSALEAALVQHRSHAWIAPLALTGLARTPALAADLQALHGEGWADALPVRTATRGYVERIHAIERRSPGLLAAHAYVRYLGDLSGGQVLRGTVCRCLGLSGEQGMAFYNFGVPEAAQWLRQHFRQGLGAIQADSEGVEQLVAEAQWSFRAHAELFLQLAPRPGALADP